MTEKPHYHFSFQIVDENTGSVLMTDFTTILPETIDAFGGCESTDHAVAAMLRGFKRRVRDEHERANYETEDKQLVTHTAGKIRAVVEGK